MRRKISGGEYKFVLVKAARMSRLSAFRGNKVAKKSETEREEERGEKRGRGSEAANESRASLECSSGAGRFLILFPATRSRPTNLRRPRPNNFAFATALNSRLLRADVANSAIAAKNHDFIFTTFSVLGYVSAN